MRRTVVVEHIDPERLVPSGIDTIVRDLVRFSESSRFAIVGVSSSRPLGVWTKVQIGGREVAFLPILRLNRDSTPGRRVPHSLAFIAAIARYRSMIRQAAIGADIHVHRVETGHAVRILGLGAPVQFIHNAAANLTGPHSESFWAKFPFVYDWIERRHLPKCVSIVVFNGAEFNRLSSVHANVHRGRTWFDPNVFKVPSAIETPRSGIVWLGRLEMQKDPLLAVDVMRELVASGERLTMRMVGDGALRDRVEAAIQAAGLTRDVTMTGALDQADVAEVLRSSEVLLMTSHFEGSPTALVEALACGTPAVATEQADPDQLLNGRNGLRVQGRDARSIASSLQSVLRTCAKDCADSVSHRSGPASVRAILNVSTGAAHA